MSRGSIHHATAAGAGLKGGGAVAGRAGIPEDFQIPDEKILGKLQDLVENCSLQGVSRKDLRCWLEHHFKVPLFHRRDLIKNAVDQYLDNVKRDIGVDGLLKISHTLPTLDQFEQVDLRKLLGWKHRYGMGCGLRNLKNSCFMNAVLQSLLYSSPLFNFLLQSNNRDDHRRSSPTTKTTSFCPLRELQKLSRDIYSSNRKQVSPTQIYSHLSHISTKLQPGRQEDAHEFLEYFLDALHGAAMKLRQSSGSKSVPRRTSSSSSFVYSMFGSCIRSQVSCQQCKHISNSYQTQLTLSLEVTDSVNTALERFTQSERLTHENQYYCSKCKRRVNAKKRLQLFSAPPILVLHLKRFSAEYSHFGYTKKIHDHIEFPERICLRNYMSDATCSPEYLLHAVVVHTGYSGNNGHYVCYVKDSNNDWHHVDDHFVMAVKREKVLQQQAYILFYTLRSSSFLPATRPISKHFNIHAILKKYRANQHAKQMRSSQSREKHSAQAKHSSRRPESNTHRVSTTARQSQRDYFPRPRSKSTNDTMSYSKSQSDWEMANISSLETNQSTGFSVARGSRGNSTRSLRSSASNASRTRSTGRRRERRHAGRETREDGRGWSGSVASTRSNDWLLSNDGLK